MSTWILLRGLTREQGHWGHFRHQFLQALPEGDVVLTPDLPGNGVLHDTESPTRVEDMVESVRHTLLAQGQHAPYHVVAMSLGAMVTVAWAHAYPHEVAHCVLINTSLRPISPFWHRLRPRNYPRIFKLLLGKPSADDWERAIMAMTTRHPANPAQTLAHWLSLRAQHPVSTRNGLRQLWAATRYRAPPQRPPVPTLILNSLGDQLVNPACSAELAQRWQLPLFKHPTAGHDLPLDAAPWVVAQIQSWLASPASQPQAASAPGP
jgi:pimeloyl-ACP methyl ester carboxylesterase